MHRTLVLAGALVLTLPSLVAAQDWHRDRRDRRDRNGRVVHRDSGFRVTIGNGNVSLGIGIHTHSNRSTPVFRRVRHWNEVTVIRQHGVWYEVVHQGRRGWIHCDDMPGYRPPVVITPRVVVPTIVRNNYAELSRLDRFNYRRELKGNGALQSAMSLVRVGHDTYQIEIEGAAVERRKVQVDGQWVRGLQRTLSRMQAFPNASFDQGRDTFYTTFSTDGRLTNGYDLNMSRAFYDVSFEPPSAALANELHAAVDQLIADIAAQTGGSSRGFNSHFGR